MRWLVSSLLVGALAAAVAFGVLPTSRPAAAQGVTRVCIPVYDTGKNQLNCVEGWLTQLLNGLTTTVKSVKNGNYGVLGIVYCYNPNQVAGYIQFFNATSPGAVTLGTTSPVFSMGIPTSQAAGIGPTDVGIIFTSGIQVAATTTAAGSTGLQTGMDCNVTFN